jgi:eukaryotic-like serine/threonine-protein kinase
MSSTSTAPLLSVSWYDLLAPIGSGAMATVHVALERGAEASRPVAVKRLHPELTADPAARRTMLAEAEIGSRLRHPNAVAVHEVEDLGDEVLLVMDYVEGASLEELVRVWPLVAPPVAIRIVLDAAAGLAALHGLCDRAGRPLHAVHHDVAPDNLLVGTDGVTRIADYGSVRCARFPTVLREPGRGGARVRYRAPECVRGYPGDARADVYALGVVTWELLAARPLVEPARPANLQRATREPAEPPRLSSVVPELGEAFDLVLQTALATDPARRFATIEQFAAEVWAAAVWTGGVAAPFDVGAAVEDLVGDALACRRADIGDERMRSSGVYARA